MAFEKNLDMQTLNTFHLTTIYYFQKIKALYECLFQSDTISVAGNACRSISLDEKGDKI